VGCAPRVVVTRESNRPTLSFKTTFSHSDVGYPNTIARCVPRRCVRESVVVGRQRESDKLLKIDPKLFDQIVCIFFLLKLAVAGSSPKRAVRGGSMSSSTKARSKNDLYEILRVEKTADSRMIRRSYYKIALTYVFGVL